MKVLFLNSVHPVLQEELEKNDIQCYFKYKETQAEIENIMHEYNGIIIRSRFRITESFIDKTTNLKFIARAGAGMENIAVEYAESKGIKCLHAPEGNRDAVAEHALGMILSLFNNLNRADREVREGKWIREDNRGIELMGKTVGVIGYGNMGSAFAQRLQGFGVKVLAYDKYKTGFSSDTVKETSLKELLGEADVLSLHVPLTAETRYMVNGNFLSQFRKNIFLINTARGKVLNTADLVSAMEAGKVKGACLDVLEYEAVSFEDLQAETLPEPFKYLIKSDKVILSPHIAGWTHESNEKIARILAEKIISLKG